MNSRSCRKDADKAGKPTRASVFLRLATLEPKACEALHAPVAPIHHQPFLALDPLITGQRPQSTKLWVLGVKGKTRV